MAAIKKAQSRKKKLSKSDPDFYRKIAALAGKKLLKKRGKQYFRDLAASSHPRKTYNGGRPKKVEE